MSLAAILGFARGAASYWREIVMATLAFACSILWGLWQHESGLRTKDKLAQANAVQKAQERADSLANELVIAQAQAMAGTEKATSAAKIELRQAPDDIARLRAISRGLHSIAGPSGP